ncbi:MAG: hypothetical protein ACYC2T_14335 [Bacillota bacterium]
MKLDQEDFGISLEGRPHQLQAMIRLDLINCEQGRQSASRSRWSG